MLRGVTLLFCATATCGLIAPRRSFPIARRPQRAPTCRMLFDKFDADNSGELDADEFEGCMKSMELGLTKGQIGALMATADTSGDGTIDKVSRARAREREKARAARGALAALFLPRSPAGMTLRARPSPTRQPLNPAAAAAGALPPTFNDKVEFMAFAFKHLMYLVKLVCARRG